MTSRVDTLYNTFSYLRGDNFNKGRACEKIRQLLYNSGYDVSISNECDHNIETLCHDPKFIIMTHYNSIFKCDADSSTSGLIGSLILSEELSSYRKEIKFIFFDNEKNGLAVLEKYKKNSKIINIDCIGRGKHILILGDDDKANSFKNDFVSYLHNKEVEILIGNFLYGSYNSENKEYSQMLTIRRADSVKKENNNEVVLPWINSEDDTIEKIDYKKITEVIKLTKRYIVNKFW